MKVFRFKRFDAESLKRFGDVIERDDEMYGPAKPTHFMFKSDGGRGDTLMLAYPPNKSGISLLLQHSNSNGSWDEGEEFDSDDLYDDVELVFENKGHNMKLTETYEKGIDVVVIPNTKSYGKYDGRVGKIISSGKSGSYVIELPNENDSFRPYDTVKVDAQDVEPTEVGQFDRFDRNAEFKLGVDESMSLRDLIGLNESIKDDLPSDYEECSQCGFDHEYAHDESQRWHTQNESQFEIGDDVSVEMAGQLYGSTRKRIGKIKSIHASGDMADVDFGNGDVFGMMMHRLTKVDPVQEGKALNFDKFMTKIVMQEGRKIDRSPDSPMRLRAARHQERPAGRIVYSRKMTK